MADAAAIITQDLPVPTPPPDARQAGRPKKAQSASVPALINVLPRTSYAWSYPQELQELSPNIDDAVLNLGGVEIYEKRMMRDPQVHSSVSIREQSVLSRNLGIRPCVKSDHPAYERAKRYAEECGDLLRMCAKPFKRSALALLRGNITGHRLADLIWKYEARYPGAGEQLVLDDIKVKPQWCYRLLADQFDNILFAWPVTAGSFPRGPLEKWPQKMLDLLIPIQKFILYIHNPEVEDASPLGTSILRSVYSFWWDKVQLMVPFRAFLATSAQPGIKYNQREGSNWEPPERLDAEGNPFTPTVSEYVKEVLADWSNGTILFAPDGDDASYMESNSHGEVFLSSFLMYDRQIAKGIHGADEATQQSEHSSRAKGQVGQDLLSLPVIYDRSNLAFTIEKQIFARYIEFNYGLDEAIYTPICDLGQFATHDTFAVWQSIAQLTGQGAMYADMLEELYAAAGLPVPDIDKDPIMPGIQAQNPIAGASSGASGGAPADGGGK